MKERERERESRRKEERNKESSFVEWLVVTRVELVKVGASKVLFG